MKKSLLIIGTNVLFSFISNAAIAENIDSGGVKVKLEGVIGFQTGFVSQNKLTGEEKKISGNREKFAFYSNAAIMATLSNTLDELTYGGRITLQPTSKAGGSPSYNGSHIFAETEYGRVEAGAPYDAASKLRVTGYDVAAATGDGWSTFAKLDGSDIKYQGAEPEFVTSEDYFFDSTFKTTLKDDIRNTEPSRKISYYIPTVHGFQFGISYIPDSGNTGTGKVNRSSTGNESFDLPNLPTDPSTTKRTMEINRNVKDALSGGIAYEHTLSEDVVLKIAATGEYGKAAGKAVKMVNKGKPDEQEGESYKLSNLRTYNLGAALTYGNVACAASYGTLGNSLSTKEYNKTGRGTKYYNAAIAYGQGPVKASVSYYKSNKFKNIVDAVTIGTEYKLAPGLLPYAEIAYFQAKGKPSLYPEAPKKKVKGTVALIGAKVKF